VRDEVVAAMTRVLREGYGNPSSVHAEGSAARAEVEGARLQVASLLGVDPGEVIFTAGATESNNTTLCAVAPALGRGRHVVSSSVEHPSVEAPLEDLESRGWRITRLEVDADGLLSADDVAEALEPDTALVSLIWANNETGVVQPMADIALRVKARGVPIHVDATQAVGKIPVDLREVPVDWLSLSAHKLGGPKGVGCLVARRDAVFAPLLLGGGQEGRRRGGTENVAGIVGLGVACALAEKELTERAAAWAALRDGLWAGIEAKIPHVHRNGPPDRVLPNTLSVEFEGTAGEVLLQALDLEGVAVSSGAACASGAMGRTPLQARGVLRLSVGHGVDRQQIDHVLSLLPDLVARVREAGLP
jgi:cysteine desulfurase